VTELTTGPIAILGAGNVGQALARGLLGAKGVRAADITLTRRHAEKLAELASTDLASPPTTARL
jgi:pyrroline-5-carboxylate reductase